MCMCRCFHGHIGTNKGKKIERDIRQAFICVCNHTFSVEYNVAHNFAKCEIVSGGRREGLNERRFALRVREIWRFRAICI